MNEALSILLAEAPVFDGHNDLPWALREGFGGDPLAAHLADNNDALHTDIPKIRRGRLGAQIWSVFVPSDLPPAEAVVATFKQIDVVHRLVSAHPDVFRFALTADDVEAAVGEGRVASLIGMEGGHAIASSLGVLRQLRRAGAAYMTLTHNDNTPWAASATGEPVDFGLTDEGRAIVREMNRIGMLVDLSHVAPRTMHDALDTTSAPVIFSHSSCRAVTDHPRNVPDDVLERLPGNGGVLMVTFVPQFVSQAAADRAQSDSQDARGDESDPAPRASLSDVVAHLEHARAVVGIDHVGLGGDFDGVPTLPDGIPDVSAYPVVLEALHDRGWSTADLGKLTFRNPLRVLREAQDAAGASW